jgi:uncharacterized membrane protein
MRGRRVRIHGYMNVEDMVNVMRAVMMSRVIAVVAMVTLLVLWLLTTPCIGAALVGTAITAGLSTATTRMTGTGKASPASR